jgi:hypothetical protein
MNQNQSRIRSDKLEPNHNLQRSSPVVIKLGQPSLEIGVYVHRIDGSQETELARFYLLAADRDSLGSLIWKCMSLQMQARIWMYFCGLWL